MKRNVSLVLLLLVLGVSCAPSPTAPQTTAPEPTTIQIAIATATQVVLPTVTATQTPAPTDTTTPTLTATPTRTNTPTNTPTPTPTLLAPLYIQGTEFLVDGKPVILKGAVTNHLELQQIMDEPSRFLSIFRRDIDTLKAMGANFVIVDWNAGYFSESGYVERLTQGLEYAKSKGLRVELTLHSRGRKPNSTWDVVELRVTDNQIITDWDKLLTDPIFTKRIADAVDIFGVVSEPAKRNTKEEDITWSEWKGIAERAIKVIRDRTGKPKVPIAYSGVYWASNAWGALNDPPESKDVAIELHPYRPNENNFRGQVSELRKRGYPVFVGEFGCQFGNNPDPIEYTEDLAKFLVANDVSFAFYAMQSDTTNAGCTLQTKNGLYTTLGNLALKYFPVGK